MEAEDLTVVAPPEEPKRLRRRVLRAIADREEPRSERSPLGRAWINGHAVDGREPRFAHLSRPHD